MKVLDFLQTEKIITPKRIKLQTHDGKDSGEWMELLSRETRESAILQSKMQQEIFKVDVESEDAVDQRYDIYTRFIASHVISWSFDEECTVEKVSVALANSQRLRNQLDQKIHELDFFLSSDD